jgi:ubiquinone/menaquinone biosynthesis C-methylase UbiE
MIQRFLRFFFKHLYTTLAWAYDLVAFTSSIGQWSEWQSVGIEHLPQGRILEIGFGTGKVLHILSSKQKQIYAIDSSHQMARISSKRLKTNGLPITLSLAQAQNLPFPNKTFQSLLATFPSEFIFNHDTLREAWRVLKPEGVFIIIPGVSHIKGIRGSKSLLGVLDELASFLYRLTGESIDADDEWKEAIKQGMEKFGFIIEIDLVEQERAVVYRIIARKKSSPR